MLQLLWAYVQHHPYVVLSVITGFFTWIINNVFTAVVASLPAPTKDSTQKYIFWFKFLNTLVGNYLRAHHTNVESSPNWQDAVDKRLSELQTIQSGVKP